MKIIIMKTASEKCLKMKDDFKFFNLIHARSLLITKINKMEHLQNYRTTKMKQIAHLQNLETTKIKKMVHLQN